MIKREYYEMKQVSLIFSKQSKGALTAFHRKMCLFN